MLPAQPSLDYASGKALFEKNWIAAPASTAASDGLGPFYNARSCNQCHPGGGRGSRKQSLILHIDDPVYGSELQRFSVPGLAPEARVSYSSTPETIALGDRRVELAVPEITIEGLRYGAMAAGFRSARLAPSLAGAGMLARIPETAIAALADAEDADGDGISGRMNRFWDAGARRYETGRFGWKAGEVSLRRQTAKALNHDLGIGNPVFDSPDGDCTAAQTDCLQMPNGNSPSHDNLEAPETVLDLLLTYVRGISPPAGVDSDTGSVSAGIALFSRIGCGGCHVEEFTVDGAVIRPYTDLLLHDMGPGLADTLEEGLARGGEWRTAPLWGLGKVRGEYLHDGRARTLEEAVLWHGGEAEGSVRRFRALSKKQRDVLIAFLFSL